MDFACLNLVLPCMLSYIKDVIGQKKQEKSNWSSVDHIPLYLGLRRQNDLMYRPTKTALWGQNPKKILCWIYYNTASVLCSVFWGHEAFGMLAPRPGIEPTPTVLEGDVVTTRKPRDPKRLLFEIHSPLLLSGREPFLHFPASFATRCNHVPQSRPVQCEQKWHHLTHETPHCHQALSTNQLAGMVDAVGGLWSCVLKVVEPCLAWVPEWPHGGPTLHWLGLEKAMSLMGLSDACCVFATTVCPTLSLVAQTGKNLPAMWETWVRPRGQEDPLEKGLATHSGILTWELSWTEEPTVQEVANSQIRLSDFHFFQPINVITQIRTSGCLVIKKQPASAVFTEKEYRRLTCLTWKYQLSFLQHVRKNSGN